MGKLLLIAGADFSTNGTPIVTPENPQLQAIKDAIEGKYYEHLRFQSIYGEDIPQVTANNRNSFGCIDASNLVPFVITPKSGCKIAPIQWWGSIGHIDPLAWTTGPVTFTDLTTWPLVGANLAYTTDADIPANTSVWDFIDVELAE